MKQTPKIRKLSYEQHRTAYPWAHKASEKHHMKTPFAEEIEYIRDPDISKKLTREMKKKMIKTISLPQEVVEEIDQKIQQMTEEQHHSTAPFAHNSSNLHIMLNVMLRLNLDILIINFISNMPRIIYNHYATTHGVPQQWITSCSNPTTNTNSDLH